MKMIVGLGNPGKEYENTRHNVGFMVLDSFVDDFVKENNFQAMISKKNIDGEDVFFVKPLTFMNLSGIAVSKIASYYKIVPEDILVIHDDMDMPIGKIRIRANGKSGGHNGIKSIMACLGTNNFNRLKIGIRHPENESVVSWVLSPFNNDQQKLMDTAFETSENVINDFIKGKNAQYLMNQYN